MGLILLAIPVVLLMIIAWAGYPWSIGHQKVEVDVVHIEPKDIHTPEGSPSVIKILTWNLGWLMGKGSEGTDYQPRSKEYFEERLKRLAHEIIEWNPDIICLQEVDFGSHRSHKLNQAEYLAYEAGYPYVAEAVSWEANYIPFPYWPFKRHFGRMKSGGAILSKYPITSHEVELLAKPAVNSWWYNIFYLHRYFQKATIQIEDKKFQLVNLHLEAFDKKEREQEIKDLIRKASSEKIDFIAGDFNMVPDSAAKKSKFHESQDDYENDRSFHLMSKSGLLESIPEEIYSKDETSYFTFPAWKPDRRLDYIFFRPHHKMMRAEILNSQLSDHLPLRATFQIGPPKFDLLSL